MPARKGSESASNASEGPHAGSLLLLKGISGCFQPGAMTALMGASGAGVLLLARPVLWRCVPFNAVLNILFLPCVTTAHPLGIAAPWGVGSPAPVSF